MKVKHSLTVGGCDDCQIVNRKGRLYRICKTSKRCKARQAGPKKRK